MAIHVTINLNGDFNYSGIKDIFTSGKVPNNDIAKLMYYLKNVFTALKCKRFSDFTNYKNYYTLSNSEINELIQLAKTFNPQIMIDKNVFILQEDLDADNKFIEITDEIMNIHPNEEILINGIITKISKLMLYKDKWLNKIYYHPLDRLNERFHGLNSVDIHNNYKANNNDELTCCTIF